MSYIEFNLKSQGYEVININYPSVKHDFSTLSDIVWNQIKEYSGEAKIHFVGYSMGGLLVRTILHKYKPKYLGRVILVGSPSKGSEIADLLQNNFFYKRLVGPAGKELVTEQQILKEISYKVDYEIGCIAGVLNGISKIIYPISYFLLKKQSDGRVSLDSTKIDGVKDYIIVALLH